MADSIPADWLAPTDPEDPDAHVCTGEGCRECDVTVLVAAAGGRALALSAGIPYESLTAEHRGHYDAIAGEVMAAMSEEMIRLGVAQPIEQDPTQEGSATR